MKHNHSIFDIIITILLSVLCCVLVVAIILNLKTDKSANQMMRAPQAEQETAQVINVTAIETSLQPFVKTTRVNGEIGSNALVLGITPEISGTVTELLVKKGDVVNQGDTIAVIDPSKPGATYKTTTVNSPISGIIQSVNVLAGQTVSTATSLVTVQNEETLIIITSIPEKYLGTLENNMQATFTCVAWPQNIYQAHVSYIAPSVNTTNRTIQVELTVDGPQEGLKEGMYVSLDLITDQVDSCIVIPTAAITTFLGNPVVFTVQDGVARRTEVTIGIANDTQSVITTGLESGQMVIVAGSAADGVAVNVL